MGTERTGYLERTPWPTWVRATFWGVTGLVCFALVAGWDTSLPAVVRVPLAASVAAGAAALHGLLGGLTVRVQETGILLHLGSWPLIRRRVPFAEILGTSAVRYHPILEFGGWGIRGTRRRRAWSARGDGAVVLKLTGGRQLLVGSDHPHRLEHRIRSARGHPERLGDPDGGGAG